MLHFHPLFHGSLCDNCFEKVKRFLMPIAASDNSNPVCCVCVSVEHNELVLCDTCVRSYCTVCLNIYCGQSGLKEILRKDPWSCFSCNEHPDTIISGLLRRSKAEQLQNIYNLYPIGLEKIEINIQETHILALEDKCAIVAKVVETLKWQHKIYNTCDHFSPAILENENSMLFDEQNEKLIVTTDKIKEWFPIGILIKYFPNCGDEDEINKFDENGVLEEFFDFIRVKNIIENVQSDNSNILLWAFETSASISYLEHNIISRFCDGRQPILLGMPVKNVRHRGRFIWTNISLQNIEKFQRVDLFLRHLKVDKNFEDQDPSSSWRNNSVYSVLSSIKQAIL
ncbi:DNA (cytosine-5)-methyltransferase 3B-like [Adelges cooleyi]|uniref:DNA (cytosine-5)-methyltransferase 3B-like n=1 Tax=Adelges cooleyi TaxID=133065 RepID=UPI00217F9B3D|nr:DNA (cytosine-5)-methyltransferase 3B-like [Adelges cooleyi]